MNGVRKTLFLTIDYEVWDVTYGGMKWWIQGCRNFGRPLVTIMGNISCFRVLSYYFPALAFYHTVGRWVIRHYIDLIDVEQLTDCWILYHNLRGLVANKTIFNQQEILMTSLMTMSCKRSMATVFHGSGEDRVVKNKDWLSHWTYVNSAGMTHVIMCADILTHRRPVKL